MIAVSILALVFVGASTKVENIKLPESNKFYWEEGIDNYRNDLVERYGDRAGQYAPWILEASHIYSIRPKTLSRLIFKESSYRNVRSRSGAIGPAQIKPRYWKKFCGAYDLSRPYDNVMCSAQILAHLKDGCGGEIRCAVAYYNAGTGTPTRGYVDYITAP